VGSLLGRPRQRVHCEQVSGQEADPDIVIGTKQMKPKKGSQPAAQVLGGQ